MLEATGHYHLPAVTQLLEANVFVCVVNALRMKKLCSQDIRKAKTDKIDSMKIAAFGLTYWQDLKRTQPTDEVYRELWLLSRQYFQLASMLTKAKIAMAISLTTLCRVLQSSYMTALPTSEHFTMRQCHPHKRRG